jgi:hypothetical protein
LKLKFTHDGWRWRGMGSGSGLMTVVSLERGDRRGPIGIIYIVSVAVLTENNSKLTMNAKKKMHHIVNHAPPTAHPLAVAGWQLYPSTRDPRAVPTACEPTRHCHCRPRHSHNNHNNHSHSHCTVSFTTPGHHRGAANRTVRMLTYSSATVTL